MHKFFTLAAAGTLFAVAAQAQITLDGIVNANEIGAAGAGRYVSLGAFTTPHVGNMGFGNWGLLRLYGANTGTKLYVALAGTVQGTGNNFQLYLDLPGRAGVPVGTALPDVPGPATVFGTFSATQGIGGTKLELEADAAFAVTGQGDVQAAIYPNATTAQAKSLTGGAGILPDGSVSTLPATETTGAYALFAGTRLAYLAPTGDITTNPGNANGGGAGSYALEIEFDRAALGLPSGASVVRLMAAQVSGDAFWSSDVIPEIPGNGNTNLGFKPDFTALAGTQSATLNVVVLSSRRADDAVVALSVFPNPAQGETTLAYQVAGSAQPVTVRVTDLLGRPVRTLLNAVTQRAGFHTLALPATDLAAGAYLVQVQVGTKTATRRLATTR
ncbi:T9SS type A sorting domain-containing protein [Hymenobacter weizhouensis]|uniref:T9SS type A sorting domain-containing protein n=1 Tax=Hymenobacter sp. YIM 151500-1 TaxID=2987689 RepID=UPI002227E038|nr:T9SS type A sorting domain-containing protein [Hymenobacter sp. YIM 151500-1]UYZ64003.1 T9SS type A sorting domain-containing protein [Hymenobacter sp. YIM 151500-1]